MRESVRRERERELLREVQEAQQQFHESDPERRSVALQRYLAAVNRFSEFVLGKEPPRRSPETKPTDS